MIPNGSVVEGERLVRGTGERALERRVGEGATASAFVWGAGIECSFLPHLHVDQFEWTQHDRFWREDFARAKNELGISTLRYAFPWHLLEKERGKFNWSMADERMEEANKLGIEFYLDVMHFGVPLWLKQAVGDPEFPEALERFTEALVGRYRGSVKTWCPCNEPLVLALFSGDLGFWPPHARKWRGYMPVLTRVMYGVNRSIRAIRRVQPEATVLLCDNVENYKTRDADLQGEVRRRNLRRFLALDLLMGRVDARHPLAKWIVSYGMNEMDLEWFRANPQSPDVLGLDYYPNSEWQLERAGGTVRQQRADNPVGIYGIGQAYYDRYGLPMMVTETSIDGQPINREIWLEQTIEECRRLRADGIPLLGYFWWPMIDQLDWDGALLHRVGKIHDVGMFNLKRTADGTLQRKETPLVKLYRDAAEAGEERVGKLERVAVPAGIEDQGPPIGVDLEGLVDDTATSAVRESVVDLPVSEGRKNGNRKQTVALKESDPVPGLAGEMGVVAAAAREGGEDKFTDRHGIVVFCHLRWGFVWQRPQQFLSRFARKHKILFVEEPFFDRGEGTEPSYILHKVMPNVVVVAMHFAESWRRNPQLPEQMEAFVRRALETVNENGEFDKPLLWYYSPMDSA